MAVINEMGYLTKSINNMSHDELLELEELLKEAKNKFYSPSNLGIVQGHLCTYKVLDYNIHGALSTVRYCDFFTGNYVDTNPITVTFPSLKGKLSENNIPFKDYMTSAEIAEAWDEYKKAVPHL